MKEKGLPLVDELRAFYTKVPAPPGNLIDGRRQMLAQAAALKPSTPPPAGVRRFFGRLRTAPTRAFAILAIVIFILATTGGGAVLASGSSLPGDLFYPLKLAVEDFRLSLSADPATQAELNMTFVVERVEDMKGLADRDEIIPDEVVTRMADQMDTVMTQTTAASSAEGPGLLEQLELGIIVQQFVLTKIQAGGSQEGNPTALNAALQVNERARLATDSAKGNANQLEHEYRVILSQPEEPSQEPPPVDNSAPLLYQNDGAAGDPQEPQGPQGPDDVPVEPAQSGNQSSPGAGTSEPDGTDEPDASQPDEPPSGASPASRP